MATIDDPFVQMYSNVYPNTTTRIDCLCYPPLPLYSFEGHQFFAGTKLLKLQCHPMIFFMPQYLRCMPVSEYIESVSTEVALGNWLVATEGTKHVV
jgi:hypothetical protein